jgi:hypothetical protein
LALVVVVVLLVTLLLLPHEQLVAVLVVFHLRVPKFVRVMSSLLRLALAAAAL